MFPSKTQLNRIMPKAKFMKLAELSTPVRAEIQNNVERLILANILRQETTNISSGKTVKEIDVFEFLLREKQVSDNLIKEIDSAIPKHILFVFKYKDLAQIAISYKEGVNNSDKFKVLKIFRTEWKRIEEFDFELNGLDLDAVFNNFITQIADGKVEIDETKDIKQAVENTIDKEKLQRKIEQLNKKLQKEKQFNKQLELRAEVKKLENELSMIKM